MSNFYEDFKVRITIQTDTREITIRDVSPEDMERMSKAFNVEISEDKYKTIRWIQFGNIDIHEKNDNL